MAHASAPIGMFDSGAGGLAVLAEVQRQLPGEDIIYLGDTARVPYGNKSPRTVEKYSLGCQRFLLDRDVKLVLIACNTASANALPALREASPVLRHWPGRGGTGVGPGGGVPPVGMVNCCPG